MRTAVAMDSVTIIGVAASAFTATSLVPQLVQLYKTKKAADLSFIMLVTLFTGLGLWVWYGVVKQDPVIIVSNLIGFIINLITAILTLRYKKNG